jgi:hypothetical protein
MPPLPHKDSLPYKPTSYPVQFILLPVVSVYQITWQPIPEDLNVNTDHHENCTPHVVVSLIRSHSGSQLLCDLFSQMLS